MTKHQSVEQALQSEHDALIQIEKEDECYTPPYGDERTNYIERTYLSNFTQNYLFANIRYYKDKKGKLHARYTKKIDGVRRNYDPVKQFIKDANGHGDSLDKIVNNTVAVLRKIDQQALDHMKQHIIFRAEQEKRKTIKKLIKERESR